MLEENTIVVNNIEYSIGKLDVKKQFHIGRRLAPMFTAWMAASGVLSSGGKKEKSVTDIAGPIVDALADMSDVDADFIIDGCLDVIRRKDGTGWQRVRAKGVMMYEDIDAVDMIQLVVAVVNRDIAGFFPKLVSLASTKAETEQTA